MCQLMNRKFKLSIKQLYHWNSGKGACLDLVTYVCNSCTYVATYLVATQF